MCQSSTVCRIGHCQKDFLNHPIENGWPHTKIKATLFAFFSQEGVHNITVVAWNRLQNFTSDVVTFEIVGAVRGMEITDNRVLSAKDEVKWFFINFESIGAGTCIVFDFHDGIIQSFGDEYFCSELAPDVEYLPGVAMVAPVIITHTY